MSTQSNGKYGVVLFDSVSHALRAERVTQRAGLKIKLIPVPRQLSSNCGTALRFYWADETAVRHTLQEAKLGFDSIHKLE